MSCNYADGLSNYENKGILGLPEKFDTEETIEKKLEILINWISTAKHVVVHTGAGISTSAGIPDFRGPKGVWTLEKLGQKPTINISFDDAKPTLTHMAIKELINTNYVHYVVSQNIDGLHLKSGLSRKYIAELHGNIFTEKCHICERQFIRTTATTSVGQKCLNKNCLATKNRGRCRGKLYDTILDWEDNLPAEDLDMAYYHSHLADLNISLGTTLQINPSGNLPLHGKKYNGKFVTINLQPTKHDSKADLIINTYVNTFITKLMKKLHLEIPEYSTDEDPTKNELMLVKEWTIQQNLINQTKKMYNLKCFNFKKRKVYDLNLSIKNSKIIKKDNEDSIKSEN